MRNAGLDVNFRPGACCLINFLRSNFDGLLVTDSVSLLLSGKVREFRCLMVTD